MIKRLMVIALAAVLGFTSIPTTAYAAQTTEVIMEESKTGEELLVEEVAVDEEIINEQQVEEVVMIDEAAPIADVLYSGSCNPTVSWYIDDTYTMYITGSGNTKVVTGGDSWLNYKYIVKTVVIEEGITTLHSGAFSNFSYLESVTLPSTLKTIEESAFSDCYNLSEVEIAEGLEVIGNAAFIGCSKLRSIVLTKTLTSLGNEAFEGCENLWFIEIPEGITQIGTETFASCGKLLDADLPETMESIGDRAFNGCIMMSEIELPESITFIGDYAFAGCNSLDEIYVPGKAVLGSNIFERCTDLIRIELGEGITETGKYMFKNCTGIELVNLPSTLTQIAEGTFYSCKNVLDFDLPSELNIIGASAFYGCNRIADFDLPSKLNVIGANAFYQCNSLKEMYLPASLTQIGDSVFDSCTNLKNIFFMGSKEQWDAISIGSTNTVLNAVALHYNSCNKNHVWKDADCDNAKTCETCKVALGEALGHSFTNYTSNGDGTKTGSCERCGLVNTTYEVKHSGTCNDTVSWALDVNNTLHIFGNGQIRDMSDNVRGYWDSLRGVIKEVIIEEGVTYVGSYVFDKCTNLEEVYMADSVTAIGQHLFDECSALRKVELSKNLETIGAYAFYNCANLEEISIPDSLVNIGTYAFGYCNKITELSIPEGVKTIGERAFNFCENVSVIHIAGALESVGNYAFWGVSNLKEVYFHGTQAQWNAIVLNEGNENLTRAKLYYNVDEGTLGNTLNWAYCTDGTLYIEGTGAMPDYTYVSSAPWLKYYNDIKKVEIDETVTSIGSYAFYNMNALQSVHIPASVESIGEAAFANCNSLTALTVDETNPYFTVQDGVLYSKDLTRLLWYPYAKADSEYEIPASLTSIDSYAFAGNTYLTKLKLTDNITSFADNTFKDCNYLKNVVWDGSYDRYYAILHEGGLGTGNDVIKSASVEILGLPYVYDILDNGTEDPADDSIKITWSYGKISGEVVIPDTIEGLPVTEIGDMAFATRTNISKLVIPDSVTTIGEQAFSMCSYMEEVVLSDNLKEIPKEAFWMCNVLSKVTMPSNLEKIGYGAFAECKLLKEIVIPESVTEMGDDVFSLCGSLEKVEIKANIETLGLNTFKGCAKLQTVILPATLKEIKDEAFSNCTSLTSIELPESLEKLGLGAFYKCTNLKSIVIPSMVTTVGEGCFMDCSALESVEILSELNYIPKSCFQRCSSLKNVVLPEIIRTIGETAFAQCSSLEEITLHEGVLMIQEQAFCQCTSLKSIVVPKNVVYLGAAAFAECTNLTTARIEGGISMLWGNTFRETGLTSITFPGTLGYVSEGDFYKCPISYVGWLGTKKSLNNLVIAAGGNDKLIAMKGKVTILCPWDYTVNSDGVSITIETLTTTKRELSGDVIIPETLDGYTVTALDSGALREESEVTSVYIPDTVTMIDQYAFYKCSSLESVRLPETLETLGTAAFRECLKLDNVVIPESLKTMDQHTFLGCSSLKSITVPGNITTIPSSAFKECASLETVVIEEGVEFIEMTAFRDCINLKKVVLPESLISMEVSSFGSTNDAKNITFYIYEDSNAETFCEKWKYNCVYIYPLKGVTLPEVIYVGKDGSTMIDAKPMPESTTDEYEFIYTLAGSEDGQENEFAFISDGSLNGLEFGETVLTVTEKNTGFSAEAIVKIIPDSESEMELILSEEIPEIGLQFKETRTLQINSNYYGVLNSDMFVFSSSDENVITVDGNGLITAVYAGSGIGEATITVTLKEDCYDRALTLDVKAIPNQTETIAIEIPVLGHLFTDGDTIVVDQALVADGAYDLIVEVPTLDKEGEVTNPEIIWTSTNANVAVGKADEEYGYVITIPAKADGAATVTATVNDYNKASAQLKFEIRDYSPRIGAAAVTLNTHKTIGADISLYPAYDSEIISVAIEGNEDLTAAYDPSRSVVTITPNALITKKTIVNLVVEAGLGGSAIEYTYPITVNVSNKLPAVTIKQQSAFNLFYKDSTAAISVTSKGEVIESVEILDTPTYEAIGFADQVLTIAYAEEDPVEGYVNGKADNAVLLKIKVEGYRTPIEKKLTISAKETKPVLAVDNKSTKLTYLGQGGAVLQVLNKTTGEAIDWTGNNGQYSVTTQAEGYYVNLVTEGKNVILNPIINGQNKFMNNKANCQVKLDVQEANWLKPINLAYTINLVGAPKLTVASKTISVNTLLETTAQTYVTADCINATAPTFDIVPTSKNAIALSGNLLSADGWNLNADVPIGTANGSYAYKLTPKWGAVAGTALAVTVKVENLNPTIKTSAKSNTLTISNVFDTVSAQIIPSTYSGIASVSYIISAQGKNAKVLENAAKIDLQANGWDISAALKDKEDLPANGSYKYDVEATLALENGVTVTLKKIAVTVKVALPKSKITLGKTSVTLNKIEESELIIPVTVTGDYEISRIEVMNDKSNKLEPFELSVMENNGQVVVEVLDDTIKDGTYKYKLTPALKLKGEEYRQETMYPAMTLSVKIISGKISLKASAKGSIDLLKRDTGIVYTITGGQNFNYAVDKVDTESFYLDGPQADKFSIEYIGTDTKGQHQVCVTAKEDVVFSTKIANKFSIVANVDGVFSDAMSQTFSVTPKQSSIKVSAIGDFNIYQAVKYGSVDLKITSPADVKIASVATAAKGSNLPAGAINYQFTDEDADGIYTVEYEVADASKLKVGAKYKLVLEVRPVGMAENMKPQNVTVTFTVKK